MAVKLKSYEKTPEKHPLYSEEWKKFWNKRYKELTAEGKDASKYDFKPEWIKFWTVRIKELHEDEVKKKLKGFRSELGLPDNNDDDSDSGSLPSVKTKEKKGKDADSDEVEDDLTVMHVVRVLAALEEQLGSLGPRINVLLVQALGMERQRPGDSEKLLDIMENCVIFETAKEKLKGQLFAGVIDKHMVKGTKKAIASIVELLAAREKRKKTIEKQAMRESALLQAEETMVAAEPLVVPGVGVVDKIAIAEQIAAALVAQGKTDVSEEELDQLINAVVGMAQASEAMAQANRDREVIIEENVKDEEKSSLQDLLSSVVKAHNAKIPTSGLQLLQNYDEPSASKTKRFSLKDMSELSDHDLKTLLQNFNDLSREEQQFLIAYLKDLESKDAASVAKLRRYINTEEDNDLPDSGRLSPFSSRQGGVNPTRDKMPTSFEDDDDEYSFEDIVKTAKENVKTERDAKKATGKELVLKMIEDQKKRAAEVLTVTSSSKSSVVIDPNDLFNGFSASSEPAKPTPPPLMSLPVTSLISLPVTSEECMVYSSSEDIFPTLITTTAVPEQPASLPATSLGPLMTAAPIDPAPELPMEPQPQWDAFPYQNPPPAFGYQESDGFDYSREPPPPLQQYQPQPVVWHEQDYEQQHAAQNPYMSQPPEYNPYAPSAVQYDPGPPHNQYSGYY